MEHSRSNSGRMELLTDKLEIALDHIEAAHWTPGQLMMDILSKIIDAWVQEATREDSA